MTLPAVELSDGRVEQLNIAAWSRRGSARQWPPFVVSLAVELQAGARPEAARRFLRQVGRRMASGAPLPKAETLREMEEAINRTWAALDWGWVRLLAHDEDIRIIHGGWPELSGTAGGEAWAAAAAAILEGVYAGWFEAQGSPLKCTEQVPGRTGALEFRHAP
jgi:hypothetical protein